MGDGKKILVTGANGFVGTRLIAALVERGQSVRALSRRAGAAFDIPPGFGWLDGGPLASSLVEWVRGDIGDRESLRRAVEGCDRVFHLAACAKNWAPRADAFYDANVLGMHNVFDAAEEAGARRIVWTSSIVALGPSAPGVVADETTPRSTDRFFNEYERTKTIAQREALQRARAGLPLVVVNPTRVYGPGHVTEANSVTRLIDDYDRGRMPVLLNRGVNVGNWVLVDDVVEGHLSAMERGRVGECYILGGENASLRDFFRAIDRISGRRHFQLPVFRPGALLFAMLQEKRAAWFGAYPKITPGWVRMFLAEWAHTSAKAERALQYRPTPLEEGLRITYQWLRRVREERT